MAVEAQVDTSEPGVVRSTLILQPLKRSDWPMALSCSASNSELSRPLDQAFEVDMDRKSEPDGPLGAPHSWTVVTDFLMVERSASQCYSRARLHPPVVHA